MIIHERIPKRKPRKPTAKQRQLQEDWQKLMKKYETKTPVTADSAPKKVQPFVRETPQYPSVDTGIGNAFKGEDRRYTGTKMIGIGTLHKSNAVPIFSEEDAVEISRMRRG